MVVDSGPRARLIETVVQSTAEFLGLCVCLCGKHRTLVAERGHHKAVVVRKCFLFVPPARVGKSNFHSPSDLLFSTGDVSDGVPYQVANHTQEEKKGVAKDSGR